MYKPGKNYSIWENNNELKKAPAKKDRVLSQITQLMYSCNLTVNLETQAYSLIIGHISKPIKADELISILAGILQAE